jgi:hypothetical protein
LSLIENQTQSDPLIKSNHTSNEKSRLPTQIIQRTDRPAGALLIYLVTPSLLRLIDPTSGEFDTGQLAVLSFGIIKVIMASLVAWAGYRSICR